MSDYTNTYTTSGFDSFNPEFAKNNPGLDFNSYQTPGDILAPHPDLFELELDDSLAAIDEIQLQLLTVDSNDAFAFLRSDTPTRGPGSGITASSESAYDSMSSHSESLFNYPQSPYSQTNYSFPLDLNMDFEKFRVGGSDYTPAGAASANGISAGSADPTSFGTLPPTPPRSPQAHGRVNNNYPARGSFSDYEPTRPSNGFPPFTANSASPQLASMTTTRDVSEESGGDSRRKYRCPSCPRSFARAYNLKTHMATHDPNRLKPHVCPHRSCGRSFSRKHDLGRHLVSIHQDESVCSAGSSATNKSIGVEGGPRGWCDSCGKGYVGRERDCSCDIK